MSWSQQTTELERPSKERMNQSDELLYVNHNTVPGRVEAIDDFLVSRWVVGRISTHYIHQSGCLYNALKMIERHIQDHVPKDSVVVRHRWYRSAKASVPHEKI